MARKMFAHRFTVKGWGFPVDMLRYDHCHPASSEDATKILLGTQVCSVNLISYAEKTWTPTVGRWNSFGWKLEKHEVGFNAINE